MCLIIIAIDIHPQYPLVIAANRDEYYHRPTAPLAFWDDMPDVLAGRDLAGGGTWLGISRTGRLAAVTNYRDPAHQDPEARSRGLLITHFLAGSIPADVYFKNLIDAGENYNGFNLVAGDMGRLWWMSNISKEIKKLTPGISGISNRLLDTPWPPVFSRLRFRHRRGRHFQSADRHRRAPRPPTAGHRGRAGMGAHAFPDICGKRYLRHPFLIGYPLPSHREIDLLGADLAGAESAPDAD